MYKKCTNCQKQIIDGVAVCPHCGTRQRPQSYQAKQDKDPYEILQVSPNAEQEVIKAAYRRLARKYHPDSSDAPSEQRMKEINWAFDTLSDAKKRSEWDGRKKSRSKPEHEPKKQRTAKSYADKQDPFSSWTWDDKEKTEEPWEKNKSQQSQASTHPKRSKSTGKIDKTSLRQAGILGLVALLMIIFPIILGSVIDYNGNSDSRVSSNQTEKDVSTVIPSYINTPFPTITPTQIQEIIYPNTSMECMHWGEINSTYLGEVVCIYGRVRIVSGEEFFTIHFSYSPSDLRLMDVNGFYWPDIEEGHCIVTKGEIRDNVKYLFLSPFVNKEPTEIYEIDKSLCE